MHYYNFNIADYIKDAWHLSLAEHGIYRQLIDWYYLDEKPIPTETQVVMRRLRLGLEDERFLVNVLSDFFILTENGYYHKRIELELERYKTQFAKNRVNGKNGGRPKKQQVTEEKTQVVITENHMATQTEPKHNPNQEPITNNQEPIKAKSKPFVAPKARPTKKPPSDFSITPDMSAWATVNGICNLQAETEAFKDHEFATAKTDWVATWRNWMRRAARNNRGSQPKAQVIGLADRVMQNFSENQQRRLAP